MEIRGEKLKQANNNFSAGRISSFSLIQRRGVRSFATLAVTPKTDSKQQAQNVQQYQPISTSLPFHKFGHVCRTLSIRGSVKRSPAGIMSTHFIGYGKYGSLGEVIFAVKRISRMFLVFDYEGPERGGFILEGRVRKADYIN